MSDVPEMSTKIVSLRDVVLKRIVATVPTDATQREIMEEMNAFALGYYHEAPVYDFEDPVADVEEKATFRP